MFICAEDSGDLLAAELIDSLRHNHFQFTLSLVGTECQKKGVSTLADLSEFAKMGLFEVFPLIIKAFKLRKKILDVIALEKPDIVMCIDGFALTHFIAKKIHKNYPNIKIVRYIAPKMWAWGRWRTGKLKGIYHLLLCCLPFEPKFFADYNITAEFVGHSVTERIKQISDDQKKYLKERYKIANNKKVILLLPGSRHSEISRLLPIFLEVAKQFDSTHQFIIPVASGKEHYFHNLSHNIIPVFGSEDRFQIFQIADIALAASGTVSLELMMCDVPAIIAYKMSWLTGILVKYLITVPYVSLINIILNKPVLPEYIQENCHIDALTSALKQHLGSSLLLAAQRQAYQQGRDSLKVFSENGIQISSADIVVSELKKYRDY